MTDIFVTHFPADAHPDAPVVVLLGWAGAADRPLAKFAEMLAGEGLVSVRGIQPVSYLFSPLELWRRRFALTLLAFLERQQLSPPRPVIFWAFSNGGASVVEQMQKLVEAEPRYARYRDLTIGFIFDSAPAYMAAGMAHKVLDTSMPPGLPRTSLRALLAVSDWVAPLHGRRQAAFWDSMLRLGWGKPLLFLYSQDDPLCSADHLTQLIAEKKRRGQRVTAYKWEQSEHVGHFKLHRAEYMALLRPFLQQCQLGAAAAAVAAAGGGGRGAHSTGAGAAAAPRAKL